MRQVPLSPLSFDPQRVANVPQHPPPSTRLMSCARIANRQFPRIIGARTVFDTQSSVREMASPSHITSGVRSHDLCCNLIFGPPINGTRVATSPDATPSRSQHVEC